MFMEKKSRVGALYPLGGLAKKKPPSNLKLRGIMWIAYKTFGSSKRIYGRGKERNFWKGASTTGLFTLNWGPR